MSIWVSEVGNQHSEVQLYGFIRKITGQCSPIMGVSSLSQRGWGLYKSIITIRIHLYVFDRFTQFRGLPKGGFLNSRTPTHPLPDSQPRTPSHTSTLPSSPTFKDLLIYCQRARASFTVLAVSLLFSVVMFTASTYTSNIRLDTPNFRFFSFTELGPSKDE